MMVLEHIYLTNGLKKIYNNKYNKNEKIKIKTNYLF